MANKLKKKVKSTPAKKPANSDVKPFRPEKDEKLDLKAIARDERTWKIIGTVSLLLAIFLFISFCSYLFTWKEDQAIASQGFSALLDNDKPVANLLGRFGAVMSYFFIFKAFGLASFLICTFFFVVGVNLLFRRKVFSIWRNLKYVTLGLLVLSVSLAFIFSNSDFAFGGGVGNMISGKLVGAMGTFGTAAALLLLAIGYFIWQFNPALKLPEKLEAKANSNEESNLETAVIPDTEKTSVNDLYTNKEDAGKKSSSVFADGSVVINFPDEEPMHDFKMIEKDDPEENIPAMKAHNVPVIMDVTHSLQQPNQTSGVTGGNPQLIGTIAKAAIATGADGLFIETHPNPAVAKSDGANMLQLDLLEELLVDLVRLRKAVI